MIIEKIAIMISTSSGVSILIKCIKQDQTTKIENKVNTRFLLIYHITKLCTVRIIILEIQFTVSEIDIIELMYIVLFFINQTILTPFFVPDH